jgi:hypothetical protein
MTVKLMAVFVRRGKAMGELTTVRSGAAVRGEGGGERGDGEELW